MLHLQTKLILVSPSPFAQTRLIKRETMIKYFAQITETRFKVQ